VNAFKLKRAPVQSTLDGSSKRFHRKLSWQGSVVGCRKTDPSVAKHPTKRKSGASSKAPLGDLVMTSRIGVFVRQGCLGHRRKTAAQGVKRRSAPGNSPGLGARLRARLRAPFDKLRAGYAAPRLE
jgi:hypothetical protein